MPGNRKAAMKEILHWVDQILPGSENASILKKQLDAMSDQQFEEYIRKLETGEEIIPLVAPNLSDTKISVQRNIDVAKQLGHDFFQHLLLTDPVTGVTYRTPMKYMVVDLPLRRQQQLLVKKISVPDDNLHVDEMTGQPAGDSHGSSFSLPEISVTHAQGLDRTIEEIIKFRGGDAKAFRASTRDVIDNGAYSMDAVKRTPTKVKSTETFSVLLKSAHLDNNL